ncbi:aspartate aminotransferase family protein [Streptomyces sp. TM32]|uniref:daptide-type RiPP biosynthesis aminotransferase n=1 Tax=Streptomyces sp. TM32 TaxID=1652669 RepID=UPI00101248F0|nr:daptide-type RiPP biosynthesis aminotransferase [Streptomyces sp. TM32]RXS69403.1 aspartate aminotransferase family protein [Streptomyces sp. TM32]
MPHPLWTLLSAPGEADPAERIAVAAEGVRIRYGDGSWALCATSGLWNVNLGYGNRAVADAVSTALAEASYLSLFRTSHAPAIAAAGALLEVCGPEQYARTVFSTSGSAANDLTMKLVRQYWTLHGDDHRRVVVGLKGSYHGLTYGSHGLTGEQLGQALYGVDQRLVRHVTHQDQGAELAALLRREGHRIAAVVVEPVLGSGAFPLSEEFLTVLQELRREHGFLLVADEVATGFGRTGMYYASERWSPRPDLLITSKGLTNGTCAAAAVLVSYGVSAAFEQSASPLVHGETQAGTPSTCAAIMATIAEMERLSAVERAVALSGRLEAMLSRLLGHSLVAGVRGMGCFRAVRLSLEGADLPHDGVLRVVSAMREVGVVVQPGPSCIQLIPALVYTGAELEELETLLTAGLDRAAEVLL